ncbi:MAG: hypothetical protein WDM79_02045 [Terricaulis sp.]
MASLEERDIDARLVVALINEGRDSEVRTDAVDLDKYVEARSRVDEPFEALRDLAEIIDVAMRFNLPTG